jgi:hypothetical protein
VFLVHDVAGRPKQPEVYPRPDGSVYVCGEPDATPLPADPAAISPPDSAVEFLRVRVG